MNPPRKNVVRRRPRSGRLEGRTAFLAIAVLSLALALSACGKKGNPQPPPGVPDTYPRAYPND